MSLGQRSAEQQFWGTPELVEKLLSFLDLAATKELAECHRLTRQILGSAFVWKKLIKKTLPGDGHIDVDPESLPKEDDPHLASVRPKAKLLSQILNLIDARPQLEMALLHTICERYPRVNFPRFPDGYNHVSVTCFSCNEIHQVLPWGFVLLEEVEATLGSRNQSILYVELGHLSLEGPLLTALGSRLTRQQDERVTLRLQRVKCDSMESVDAFATLVEHCQEKGQWVWRSSGYQEPSIYLKGEVGGAAGWATIRRAVERLPDPRKNIALRCQRESLMAGRREDLKAIWSVVKDWSVDSGNQGPLCFDKDYLGEEMGWEGFEGDSWPIISRRGGHRKGLDAMLDMNEKEWMEELRHVTYCEEREMELYGRDSTEEEEEEEEEDDEEEEEEDEEVGEEDSGA